MKSNHPAASTSASPGTPAPTVQIGPKARIIRNVFRNGFTIDDIEWNPWVEPGRAGVENHVLWAPTGDDPSVGLLLRFPPGAHGDFHEHLGIELMLVLDGVLEHSDGDRYHPGDLVIEEPSSQHQMSSVGGCTVLAIRTRPADPRPDPRVQPSTQEDVAPGGEFVDQRVEDGEAAPERGDADTAVDQESC